MSKRQGVQVKRKSVNAKERSQTIEKELSLQSYLSLRKEKQPARSPEGLKALRRFRPVYIKKFLSTVLSVGAGRSRLALISVDEENASRH